MILYSKECKGIAKVSENLTRARKIESIFDKSNEIKGWKGSEMHKLEKIEVSENSFDDNNERDFEEDGVDVLSGSCRRRFAFIYQLFFADTFFSLYFKVRNEIR